MKIRTLTLLATLFWSATVTAQVIQWRGEKRDGHFRNETGLMKQWPEAGPQLVLKVEKLGKGYSSPVVAGETIYITGMIDTLDYLSAVDFQGNLKWQVPYGRSWSKSFPETRSTPTIDGNRIYVVGGVGRLVCINAADGKEVWAVNVDQDYEADWHMWGVSESALVVDDLVICTPGGKKTSVVAFNKFTGKEVWHSASVGGQRSYVSPALYENGNFRFILAATATHLIALKPETGEVAWSYKYYLPEKWDQPGLIWTNTPIYHGDEIYLSKGYDYRSVMLKMNADGTGVTEKYINTVLDNHHHGVVLVDGYVYASNWINNGKGNWVCMDWNTGEIKWETTWNNKGSLVYADGMLYLYEEKGGHVALVKPTPEKLEVVSSFKVTDGSGPHWAHPFISGGKLYLRHGEVLMVYDIRG